MSAKSELHLVKQDKYSQYARHNIARNLDAFINI